MIRSEHRAILLGLRLLQKRICAINKVNGWNNKTRQRGDSVALLHSEVSELYEWDRLPNQPTTSDHIPDYSGQEEELADLLIRTLDEMDRRGARLEAVFDKLEYNAHRGYRHGGKVV